MMSQIESQPDKKPNMKHITIVGQGPGRLGEGRKPFEGKGSGSRLAEIAGVSSLDEVAVLTNLLPRFYGKQGKGDSFPLKKARAEAKNMTLRTKKILLCGKNVARAFGIKADYFEKTTVCGKIAYVIPHPSGVNRWWNDEENKLRARAFFAKLLQ